MSKLTCPYHHIILPVTHTPTLNVERHHGADLGEPKKLSNVVAFLKNVDILDFDEDAEQIFKQMLNQNQALRRKRVEQDMRIAAIALTYDAVLVTRNHRDFSPVPNLNLEDWSI